MTLFLVAKRRWLAWIGMMTAFLAVEVPLFMLVGNPAFGPDAGNGAAFGAAAIFAPAELAFLLALVGAVLAAAYHFWRQSQDFGTGKND
jgi:hypothetical protein